MADFIDYYSLLGVTPDADAAEIQSAFRAAAQAWHSDRWAHASEAQRQRADEMMKRVNAAKDTLLDAQSRAGYDRLRGARQESADGAAAASDHEEFVGLMCPHCHEPQSFASAGRWMNLTCVECGEAFLALVGAECRSSTHRSDGSGSQVFSVRARLSDGSEEIVSFVGSEFTNVRQTDTFSIVYPRSGALPASIYNHKLGAYWWLTQPVAATPPRETDYFGMVAGVGSWLLAFVILRPGFGDALSIAFVLLVTPVAAYRMGRSPGRWLAASVFSAGLATFVLLCIRPPLTGARSPAPSDFRLSKPVSLAISWWTVATGITAGIALAQMPPAVSGHGGGAYFWGAVAAALLLWLGVHGYRWVDRGVAKDWLASALVTTAPATVAFAILLAGSTSRAERPWGVALDVVAALAAAVMLGAGWFRSRGLLAGAAPSVVRLARRLPATRRLDGLRRRPNPNPVSDVAVRAPEGPS